MQPINSESALNAAILELQNRQDHEEQIIKAQVGAVYQSIKPANLIKNTIKEVAGAQDVKGDLVNIAIGLTTNIVSKKVIAGISDSPMKRMVANALISTATDMITQHPDTVKAVAKGLLDIIGNTLKERAEQRRAAKDATQKA